MVLKIRGNVSPMLQEIRPQHPYFTGLPNAVDPAVPSKTPAHQLGLMLTLPPLRRGPGGEGIGVGAGGGTYLRSRGGGEIGEIGVKGVMGVTGRESWTGVMYLTGSEWGGDTGLKERRDGEPYGGVGGNRAM